MENYVVLRKVGEGTFGEVFQARHRESKQLVALKKVRIRNISAGLPKNVLREIKSLENLESPHVLHLFEYFPFGSCVVLVLDHMATDLHQIMKSAARRRHALSLEMVRAATRMMLQGLAAVHRARVMHRDIKPSNLLISAQGILRLGDFGTARVALVGGEAAANAAAAAATAADPCSSAASSAAATAAAAAVRSPSPLPLSHPAPSAVMLRETSRDGGGASAALFSHEVGTRWYKAPELLFGAKTYGASIDIWSAGCVFAELLLGSPLFPGDNDIDQLYRIFKVLGSPLAAEGGEGADEGSTSTATSASSWPGVVNLPDFHKLSFPNLPAEPWSKVLPDAPAAALDLLRAMLVLDPDRRVSAEQALAHPFLLAEGGAAATRQSPARGTTGEAKAAGAERPSGETGDGGKDEDDDGARVCAEDARLLRPWAVLASKDREVRDAKEEAQVHDYDDDGGVDGDVFDSVYDDEEDEADDEDEKGDQGAAGQGQGQGQGQGKALPALPLALGTATEDAVAREAWDPVVPLTPVTPNKPPASTAERTSGRRGMGAPRSAKGTRPPMEPPRAVVRFLERALGLSGAGPRQAGAGTGTGAGAVTGASAAAGVAAAATFGEAGTAAGDGDAATPASPTPPAGPASGSGPAVRALAVALWMDLLASAAASGMSPHYLLEEGEHAADPYLRWHARGSAHGHAQQHAGGPAAGAAGPGVGRHSRKLSCELSAAGD